MIADGGLLGDVQLAWDAAHGIPLGIAIYSRDSGNPVLELKATDISFGQVNSGDLSVKAPAGAKTVQVAPSADRSHARTNGKGQRSHADVTGGQRSHADVTGGQRSHADVTGPAAVQAHLPFTLGAPATLVGLPRQSAQLLDWSGHPAALVTYGQGLGGIAVIEQTATSQTSTSTSTSPRPRRSHRRGAGIIRD